MYNDFFLHLIIIMATAGRLISIKLFFKYIVITRKMDKRHICA